MNKDFKPILSDLNTEIEQAKLIQYLNNELSDKEQQSLESNHIDDEFINDALEGLEHLQNKKNFKSIQKELNNRINKEIKNKKRRKSKRLLKESPWVYFAIILLLILLGASYFIITRILQ